MNKWLDILDSLGLFEWSEKQPDRYAPGGSWSRDDIENILSVLENEYGGVSDKLDKTNLLKAIGKTSWNILTNQNSDPFAGKFFETLDDAYFRPGRPESPTNDDMLEIFNLYQDKFSVLNKKGEKVAKDIINRGLYRGDYLEAKLMVEKVKKDPEKLWEWDMDIDKKLGVDVKDVVKAVGL
jgi:hypothetical protein